MKRQKTIQVQEEDICLQVKRCIQDLKDKKVSVIKYKNKTRYLRNKGHRQNYTKVKISKID